MMVLVECVNIFKICNVILWTVFHSDYHSLTPALPRVFLAFVVQKHPEITGPPLAFALDTLTQKTGPTQLGRGYSCE